MAHNARCSWKSRIPLKVHPFQLIRYLLQMLKGQSWASLTLSRQRQVGYGRSCIQARWEYHTVNSIYCRKLLFCQMKTFYHPFDIGSFANIFNVHEYCLTHPYNASLYVQFTAVNLWQYDNIYYNFCQVCAMRQYFFLNDHDRTKLFIIIILLFYII